MLLSLPIELCLQTLSHTDAPTIRSITQTSHTLCQIAQPLLFNHVHLTHLNPNVLTIPRLSHAIHHLHIYPSTANYLAESLPGALPALTRLACHDITLSADHWCFAFALLGQLTHLDLYASSTTCPGPCPFPLPPQLQSLTCTNPDTAHAILATLVDSSPLPLISLQIPVQSLASPLFIPALSACPALLSLSITCTPALPSPPPSPQGFLPAHILPLLSSYRGPHSHAPFFAHDHSLAYIALTLPSESPLPFPFPALHTHTLEYTVPQSHLSESLFPAIHTAFPSLTHLITGPRPTLDIHSLARILHPGSSLLSPSISSIQLCG